MLRNNLLSELKSFSKAFAATLIMKKLFKNVGNNGIGRKLLESDVASSSTQTITSTSFKQKAKISPLNPTIPGRSLAVNFRKKCGEKK